MDNGLKPRKRNGVLTTLFKRRRITTQNVDQRVTAKIVEERSDLFDDRQRTRDRYLKAAKLLQEKVKGGGNWGINFPELNDKAEEDFNDSQFREKLDKMMEAHRDVIKDREGWSKCRYIVEKIFDICSPFAKHFLTVATNVQSVLFNICSILTLDRPAESLRITFWRITFIDSGGIVSSCVPDE